MFCWGLQRLWSWDLCEPPRWIPMYLQPWLPAPPQPGLLHRYLQGDLYLLSGGGRGKEEQGVETESRGQAA